MKKIKLCAALCLMMLSSTITKADVYTDGLMKLVEQGTAMYNTSEIASQFKAAGNVNDSYVNGKFKSDIAEIMAPYYRDNMPESDFKAMISYYTSPTNKAFIEKITKVSGASSKTIQSSLQGVMMEIFQGSTPSNLPEPECDDKLKAEYEKYCEVSDIESLATQTMSGITNMFERMAPNASAEEKEQGKMLINAIMSYLSKNIKTIGLMTMIENNITVDDLKNYNKMSEEPFYPSYSKANKALAADGGKVAEKIINLFLNGNN